MSRVLLILGSGPNIGTSVAKAFSEKGYAVATSSRTAKDKTDDIKLHIQADLGDPTSVKSVFQKVTSELGPPSVVVYNAAWLIYTPAEDPFSLPLEKFQATLNVNTVSAFAAAQEAVAAFDKAPAGPRTFIYTGNILNNGPAPGFVSLGVGKTATAHLLSSADAAYKAKGYRFYYADERQSDGQPMYTGISGEAAAQFYPQLVEEETSVPLIATFVKDKGYVKFDN